jgi:hypothetical protein
MALAGRPVAGHDDGVLAMGDVDVLGDDSRQAG